MCDEFIFGLAGGFLAEVLAIYRFRTVGPKEFPLYFKSIVYWVPTALMVAAGGALAFAYSKSGITLQPIVAMNIGASAPFILGNLIAKSPKELD